jgi:autotransporter-associated beta strand protein
VGSGLLTIHSVLGGSAGLRKTGSGTLVLVGDHLLTGTTSIVEGTVTLNRSLASDVLAIASGARMIVPTDTKKPRKSLTCGSLKEVAGVGFECS